MSAKLHLALLICAVCAAPAAAGTQSYGSSLRPRATVIEAHQADSAFWPTSIAGGRAARSPATGQILSIRLKGTVLPSTDPAAPAPLSQVHFQHLRPRSRGRMLVLQSSAAFDVPTGGDPNTITTFVPENLCVNKGDVIAFNDEGGWDPPFFQNGAPFRVFGHVHGSRTARYTQNNGTNNGDTFTPTVRNDTELLMRMVLGTGGRVSYACRDFNRTHAP